MSNSASVSNVFHWISRGPRPERNDEQVLVERASKGDRDAIERLTASNLAYVVHIAKEFRGRGVLFEDLIAEGCVGLLKAIKRYRAGNGTRFMTYASFWVRKELLAAISDQPHPIHLPRYARQHGHDPIRVTCLDAPLNADGDLRLVDCLRQQDPLPADTMIDSERTHHVRREVLRLTSRERAIIIWRFGLGGEDRQTLTEIAGRLGLSKERVRQIEAAVLAQLRDAMTRSAAPVRVGLA